MLLFRKSKNIFHVNLRICIILIMITTYTAFYTGIATAGNNLIYEYGTSDNRQYSITNIIPSCEQRGPYLIYNPVVIIEPDEPFQIEILLDDDCPKLTNNFYIDLDDDDIYELNGTLKKKILLISGNFSIPGNHPIKGTIEGQYGKTDFYIDVFVTSEKMSVSDVRQELYPFLYAKPHIPDTQKTSSIFSTDKETGIFHYHTQQADEIRQKRVLILLGSTEERFWIDINLIYFMLMNKYNFTHEEIILYTHDTNVPAIMTDFNVSWIDGINTMSLLNETFYNLSNELDENDFFFMIFDGHGSGYYGPRTYRPYYSGKTPNSVYDGPLDPLEYDDPDYKESEFKTELFQSGQVNCAKYDGTNISKGLDTFMPCYDYYSVAISTNDTYYRFKVVSHFENLTLINGTNVSDNDIYLEKIISYAKCDQNHNTIIEEDEVALCDWDEDGNKLDYSVYIEGQNYKYYDEDDWSENYSVEEGYHPYYAVNGLFYCFVDKDLNNTLDIIAFNSSSDPVYLDCISGLADPGDLIVRGTDTDNDGYSNYLDMNLDSDLLDYISFDEFLSSSYILYDDELSNLFSQIDPGTTKSFFTESCFSGGFIRDLSNMSIITLTASEEDDTSSGNYFIRHFFMSLNNGCDQFGTPSAYPGYDCGSFFYNDINESLDIDNDGLISFAEAFLKSYDERVSSDV